MVYGFSLLFFTCFNLVFTNIVVATEDFKTICGTSYQVFEDRRALVNQEISLVNLKPDLYVSQYSLIINGDQIENVSAWDRLGPLKITLKKENDTTEILLTFNEKVVGLNQTLSFIVKYDIKNFIKKEGNIWRISLPKLANESQSESYKLELSVPQSLGLLAYASPYPQAIKKVNNLTTYVFDKSDLAERGAILEFGDYQIFDFTLNYHLFNSEGQTVTNQIALPPDTPYQKVYLEEIQPLPSNVKIDSDGNWLADFMLKPAENINIKVVGKAKIFSSPLNHLSASSQDYSSLTTTKKFWETDAEKIKKMAADLKTPRDIYNFVVKTLTYNYDLVSPTRERLGALSILSNPKNALCLEFTDLFVALARAAGIPAREIEGFAYTNSPKLRPLSLTQDILHAWPEYYDQNEDVWRMIDPTWGKTTGGFDYFTNFDMSHLTFVLHGQDSVIPLSPGAYRLKESTGKDIFVEFGKDLSLGSPKVSVIFTLPKFSLFDKTVTGTIEIKNSGPTALYDLPLEITKAEELSAKLSNNLIQALPPFAKSKISFTINNPNYFFKKIRIESLVFTVAGQKFEQELTGESFLRTNFVFVISLLLVIVISGGLLFFKFAKRKKVKNDKITDRVS